MLGAARGDAQGGQEGPGAVLAFGQPCRQGPHLPAGSSGLPPARTRRAEGGDGAAAVGPLRRVVSATPQLSAAPCGSPGWVPLCFVLCWRMPGTVSGVWSLIRELRSPFSLETTNGDAGMEPPGCRGTPGEGGEMDGEDKQNQRQI